MGKQWEVFQLEEEEKQDEETDTVENTVENTVEKKSKPKKKDRHRKRKSEELSVLLMNIRGLKSKEYSLRKIIKRVKPGVIALNETQLKGRVNIDLKPFTWWNKNRCEKGGGGVATGVAQELKDHTVGAGEGEGKDEYLITRIEAFSPAINVINCYGEQRSTRVEEVEARWRRLLGDMQTIRAKGEHVMLAGDLNKLVGDDELGVPGNSPEVSPGGRLLRGLLATGEWALVNAMGEQVVQGGPWTREDPATGGLSCLDMFVVSEGLRPHVKRLDIDSKRGMAASRVMRQGRGVRRVYSDHYTCLLTLTGLRRKGGEKKEKEELKWNLGREGGWEKYEKITEKYKDKLATIIDEEGLTIDEKMNKVRKVDTKIMFSAFGKVQIKTSHDDKVNGDEESAEEQLKEQEKLIEEEILKIKEDNKCKTSRIWDIRKKVLGGKKAKSEATAVVDPETNKLVVSKKEIQRVTLDYCKATLENNQIDPDFKEEINEKQKQVSIKLKEKDGEFEVKKETFIKIVDKFKRSRKPNYFPLVKASKSYQFNMFKLCQEFLEKEQFPDSFKDTTLHMIFKGGKGNRAVLSDNRFIHSKSWLPRLAEAMVVEEGLKGPLVAESTMFQVGGQPGHRAEELMFVIKSLIAKYRKEGKAIIIQAWDISKYFDKEMVEDAILTCYKRNANPKAVRLWAKLNADTRIKVKTGTGTSGTAQVGAVVGQGTIGGALVSQAVLDEGVKEQFVPGGLGELTYGTVPMGPCMFQDDLIHCSTGTKEARKASEKIDLVMKKHNLKLNEKKSISIIMGSKKQQEAIKTELNQKPLLCGEVEVNPKKSDKWLGQQLAEGGLNESVAETVSAREAKVKGAAMEIVSIVKDWRTDAVGGMETALTLWEACVVPTLLHGSGTWTNMAVGTERKLNSLQQWFVRLVLEVGPGAPLSALGWDTGLLDMRLRVWREKIKMVLHLRTLGETSLASKVYKEQVAKGWPGLAREAKEICSQIGIEDCNNTKMDLGEYRKLVCVAIERTNEQLLRKQANGKVKCDRLNRESYGKKVYLSLHKIKDVREMFKTRWGLLPFAGNYSNDRRFAKTNWRCRCGEREVEGHLTRCPVYNDISSMFNNLNDDQQLVEFYREVLERREMLERLEREEEDQGEEPLVVELTTDVCQSLVGTSQFSHGCGLN